MPRGRANQNRAPGRGAAASVSGARYRILDTVLQLDYGVARWRLFRESHPMGRAGSDRNCRGGYRPLGCWRISSAYRNPNIVLYGGACSGANSGGWIYLPAYLHGRDLRSNDEAESWRSAHDF